MTAEGGLGPTPEAWGHPRVLSSAATTCDRHRDVAATSNCADCSVPTCATCSVVVPRLGTFCVDCALRRGGLRHGRHPRSVATEDPSGPEDEHDIASWDEEPAGTIERAARQFEAHVGAREARPLISGLSERLVRCGVDPDHTIDPSELYGVVEHMRGLLSDPRREPHAHLRPPTHRHHLVDHWIPPWLHHRAPPVLAAGRIDLRVPNRPAGRMLGPGQPSSSAPGHHQPT
jgi:hypothetical protein